MGDQLRPTDKMGRVSVGTDKHLLGHNGGLSNAGQKMEKSIMGVARTREAALPALRSDGNIAETVLNKRGFLSAGRGKCRFFYQFRIDSCPNRKPILSMWKR